MDRIIEVKVGGNFLRKDSKNAGVRGEANVARLRITFDEGWDAYTFKKVTFWDARGLNPVERILTTDLIENIAKSRRIYLVPIPAEPMAEAGMLTFVIEGSVDGKVQRSLSDQLEVKDAPITDEAQEPVAPTPTQLEQLQQQFGAVIEKVADAYQAQANAQKSADESKESATKALEAQKSVEMAVGKTSYIGANGNWFAWDSETEAFYDTMVKAQAGSTVYLGTNPPDEADVWVDPSGEVEDSFTPSEIETIKGLVQNEIKSLSAPSKAYVNILGGSSNWEAENVKDASGNVIGVRYGQEVNVNNAVITKYSKVDLQINSEQMVIFYQKDIAFVTENDGGVVTVYCVGQIPENDYKIQAIVTEVSVDG